MTSSMPHPATDSQPTPLRRIRRLSLLLAHSCLSLIVVLPVALIVFWLTAGDAQLSAHANLDALPIEQPLALWQRTAGAGVELGYLACLLLGLWNARHCFQLFAAGRYFDVQAIHGLRRFAAWACASVLASFLGIPTLSVLMTLNNAPGHRHLTIGVSSEHLFTLFVAGMVWLIASVMTHACALAEENAQFV